MTPTDEVSGEVLLEEMLTSAKAGDKYAVRALLLLAECKTLQARIEALEKDRDEWSGAARHLLEHYPEDVFPPNGNTPDAKAGTFARRLLTWLLDPVERTRLAALVAEEPMQPTMYAGSSALREWADLHGEQGKGS